VSVTVAISIGVSNAITISVFAAALINWLAGDTEITLGPVCENDNSRKHKHKAVVKINFIFNLN
jgi:hypothetical protein